MTRTTVGETIAFQEILEQRRLANIEYDAACDRAAGKKACPAAACRRCEGWTGFGGMAQFSHATEPVMGRTGCTCH